MERPRFIGKLSNSELLPGSVSRSDDQSGNIRKTIEHYEKFLDLWKDVDPDLPEVEDAKKRLAELR